MDKKVLLRDKIVHSLCNFIFRFASKEYRDMINATFECGIMVLDALEEQIEQEKQNK